VTTDDREHQLWTAATARNEAATRVLKVVPERWTASLLSNRLKPAEEEALNLKSGEVHEITGDRQTPALKTI
jgi:hypothetical protein